MTIAWQYGRLKANGPPQCLNAFSGNLGALAVSYPYEKIAKACQRALEFPEVSCSCAAKYFDLKRSAYK
jgi:hypothetical protein